MNEHIQSIREQGKEIVLVDLSNCRPSEVETVARNFPAYITQRDRGSVLLLVDFSGASVDKETIRTMKESAVFDKPYINRSAWIGAQNFPPEFHKEITTFSRREMPIFDTRQEAVDWLVRD